MKTRTIHFFQDKETQELYERMEKENQAMARGDLHNSKIALIKKEREALKAKGILVPKMPVGSHYCEEEMSSRLTQLKQ